MSMLVCKDLGCAVNYCSLVKMDYPSMWEGSGDCREEIQNFNKCMVAERRRYAWMDKTIRPPMYDYVQARIKERALESKHAFLTDDERETIRKLYSETTALAAPEK